MPARVSIDGRNDLVRARSAPGAGEVALSDRRGVTSCRPGTTVDGRRARQDGEDDHGAAAARAALGGALLDGILGPVWRAVPGRRRVEQPAAERELGGAVAVGEEAVVADAVEAVRQGVQQEAADELVGARAS